MVLAEDPDCVARATKWLTFAPSRPARVSSLVPERFESYVRVFHPAWREVTERDLPLDASGDSREGALVVTASDGVQWRAVTWHEVAGATGAVAHPGMQWTAICGVDDATRDEERSLPWERAPHRDSLPRRTVDVLTQILARFTDTADRCWCAVWEGYADMIGLKYDASLPRVVAGGRTLIVGHGPVRAVPQASFNDGFGAGSDIEGYRDPSLWWPQDHAWCVSTDVDMDSTLIGASSDCAARLLGDSHLEALPARADQLITFASDTINSEAGSVVGRSTLTPQSTGKDCNDSRATSPPAAPFADICGGHPC